MSKKFYILGIVFNLLFGAIAGGAWIFVAIGFLGFFGGPTTESIIFSSVVTVLYFTLLILGNVILVKKAKVKDGSFTTGLYLITSILALAIAVVITSFWLFFK